jgi:hypothetical protein
LTHVKALMAEPRQAKSTRRGPTSTA